VYLQGSLYSVSFFVITIICFPVCIPFSAIYRAVPHLAHSHVQWVLWYVFTVMTRLWDFPLLRLQIFGTYPLCHPFMLVSLFPTKRILFAIVAHVCGFPWGNSVLASHCQLLSRQ
jgi:hypothetical protein